VLLSLGITCAIMVTVIAGLGVGVCIVSTVWNVMNKENLRGQSVQFITHSLQWQRACNVQTLHVEISTFISPDDPKYKNWHQENSHKYLFML
jgi:hypothetical protein